jgi:phage tail sheath protein FI
VKLTEEEGSDMVQVSYPGVYVQEVASGAATITGVATSIAAFVGMAKDGPVGIPTLVLGFTDYTRVFSNDVSRGEMTDQVRQFFLNGGSQAFIVRIGSGIVSAFTVLNTATGTPTLTLTAVSGGTNGNNLRVAVDYATNFPELTFNLTIFQEITDSSGNTSTANQEVHRDLSMDPNNARYAPTILGNASKLVTATDSLVAAGTTAFSAGATQAADIVATINSAITATGTGQGKFKVSYKGGPFITISVPAGALTTDLTPLTALINTQMGLTPGTITASSNGPTGAHFLALSTNQDILVSPGDDSDIARALGLGTGQGGIESGLFSANRPAPTGLVSEIGTDATLAQLMTFALSSKAGWNDNTKSVTLTGSGGIPLAILATAFTFPGFPSVAATDVMNEPSRQGALPLSLLNVRDCLIAIASTITNQSSQWQASVGNGSYRIALRPKTGRATAGGSQSFVVNVSPPGFVVSATPAASIFGASTTTSLTSLPAAVAFEHGQDGGKPGPGDYADAYTALDKVDLFNLLLLPRSVGDNNDRFTQGLWGPASVFAQSRRAFLVMDARNDIEAVSDAATEVVALRAGLVKDHAATYWPPVKINPDGNARFIDPSGSVAGVMARIDANRGVWKAPAGIEASLNGVLAVEVVLSDKENGVLNPLALNNIRSFPNGIVVWGARTMDGFDNSGDDDFKYVPVRRFESFIAESLIRGLKFAVFEPNAEPLWAQIRLSVGAFLNNLFRQGAFAGKTTQTAYFVKVDSETTTQNDINLGIVNVIVGFAPLKPAEFVVITIKQLAGQVQV